MILTFDILIRAEEHFGIDNNGLKNYNDIADFLFFEPKGLDITQFQGGVLK